MIHQRCGLGRSTESGDGLPLGLQLLQQRRQFRLHRINAGGIRLKRFGPVQPDFFLKRDKIGDRRIFVVGAARQSRDPAQAAAMAIDTLGVDQAHSVRFKKPRERLNRMIGEMLVVNRVEKGFFKDIDKIGDLENENPLG